MVTILQGDCRELLPRLTPGSINCCVTSPPYWGLRDYGVAGQIGLEKSLADWLAVMVEVFRGVRGAMRPDGTLWVNCGDRYVTGGGSGAQGETGARRGRRHSAPALVDGAAASNGLRPKQLIGLPWRLAFALQADGWILRSDVVWEKPNAKPESAKDRPSKAHDYVFLFSLRRHYYYDRKAIMERTTGTAHPRGEGVNPKARGYITPSAWDTSTGDGQHGVYHRAGREKGQYRSAVKPAQNESFSRNLRHVVQVRNKRSVWSIPTEPFRGAHFATFPRALVAPCILAGCPPGGTVLDCFGGTGTTGEVAEYLGRNSVLMELNPHYVAMQKRRTAQGGLLLK